MLYFSNPPANGSDTNPNYNQAVSLIERAITDQDIDLIYNMDTDKLSQVNILNLLVILRQKCEFDNVDQNNFIQLIHDALIESKPVHLPLILKRIRNSKEDNIVELELYLDLLKGKFQDPESDYKVYECLSEAVKKAVNQDDLTVLTWLLNHYYPESVEYYNLQQTALNAQKQTHLRGTVATYLADNHGLKLGFSIAELSEYGIYGLIYLLQQRSAEGAFNNAPVATQFQPAYEYEQSKNKNKNKRKKGESLEAPAVKFVKTEESENNNNAISSSKSKNKRKKGESHDAPDLKYVKTDENNSPIYRKNTNR